MTARRLVVVGDSLTFYLERDTVDPPLDDPRTMPLRMAAHLTELTGEHWSVVNLAEGGRAVFDAYNVLRRDGDAQATIAAADAVLFACGTKDGALHAIPRPVRAVIGRIPKPHRTTFVHWLKPKLAKVTSRQFQMTRDHLFAARWHGCLDIIRELNPTATLVCATPAREYGPQTWLEFPPDWLAPGGFVSKVHALIDGAGLPKLDYVGLIDAHLPPVQEGWDYLHWPAEMHDRVGREAAALLASVRAPAPQRVLVAR